MQHILREVIEAFIAERFPQTPAGTVYLARQITDVEQLKSLIVALMTASDQAAVEQILREIEHGA